MKFSPDEAMKWVRVVNAIKPDRLAVIKDAVKEWLDENKQDFLDALRNRQRR